MAPDPMIFKKPALNVVYYFSQGPIDPFLDGDAKLRGLAMACLGEKDPGFDPIPQEIWDKLFPKAKR